MNVPFEDLSKQAPGVNPGEWVESEARKLGVSVTRIAREAKIDRATIFRWKKDETSPYWDTWQRVQNVIRGYWDRQEKRGA
jgi:hypothetical protein